VVEAGRAALEARRSKAAAVAAAAEEKDKWIKLRKKSSEGAGETFGEDRVDEEEEEDGDDGNNEERKERRDGGDTDISPNSTNKKVSMSGFGGNGKKVSMSGFGGNGGGGGSNGFGTTKKNLPPPRGAGATAVAAVATAAVEGARVRAGNLRERVSDQLAERRDATYGGGAAFTKAARKASHARAKRAARRATFGTYEVE
jgi:hypothetical protein